MYCGGTCTITTEWEGLTVRIATPLPVTPFLAAVKQRCPSARWDGVSWKVSPHEAPEAVALVYDYFATVRDERAAAQRPAFDDSAPAPDGAAIEATRQALEPAASPLCMLAHGRTFGWHTYVSPLGPLSEQRSELLLRLGIIPLYRVWRGYDLVSPALRFWTDLWERRAELVQQTELPDGSIRETLAPATALAAWESIRRRTCGEPPATCGERWYPPRSWAVTWLAAMIVCINAESGARPFVYDAATGVFTRTLPRWPLRIPATTVQRTEVRDVVHPIVSAVILPGQYTEDGKDGLLHLSAVGHAAKLRALWAAILHGKREPVRVIAHGRQWYGHRLPGRAQYVTDWNETPLPQSGYAHLSLTHRSAFEPELGQSFLHLSGNDLHAQPDLALFAQQLGRAISLPFDPAWAEQLWRYGLVPESGERDPLIRKLPSIGCTGYWVHADERRWTRMIVAIQRGISPNDLLHRDIAITEVGLAAHVDGIVEYGGEGDDEQTEEFDE